MASPEKISVHVSQSFRTSPARVFDAWIDPAKLGRWMFGPAVRDEEVVRLDVDPRIDGKFSFLVKRQGQEIDHVGHYLEVAPPRGLTFTWAIGEDGADASIVTVVIGPRAEGSELRLTHEMGAEWAEYKDRTEESWKKMLAALATFLG